MADLSNMSFQSLLELMKSLSLNSPANTHEFPDNRSRLDNIPSTSCVPSTSSVPVSDLLQKGQTTPTSTEQTSSNQRSPPELENLSFSSLAITGEFPSSPENIPFSSPVPVSDFLLECQTTPTATRKTANNQCSPSDLENLSFSSLAITREFPSGPENIPFTSPAPVSDLLQEGQTTPRTIGETAINQRPPSLLEGLVNLAPWNSQSRKPRKAKSNIDENARSDSTKKNQPKNDEIRVRVVGIVQSVQKDGFTVIVEEGPYADRRLRCYSHHLSDASIPIIVNKTRFLLGIKICKTNENRIIVLWATLLDYIRVTSVDVCKALELSEEDAHEKFIQKLYFSWRPFFKSMLIHAQTFDPETMVLIMSRILPPQNESHSRRNRHHELRFQEIIELFGSNESMFFPRLGRLNICDQQLVKRLAQLVTGFTKQLEPVCSLLRKYYMDDPRSLIELIESCSTAFDPMLKALGAQNFRDVPLIPVMEELTGVINSLVTHSGDPTTRTLLQLESHLVPNRVDGPWDSPEEFLNVHFRLLREECFASIRNRIASVRLESLKYQQVHRDVKVIGYAISDGTIVVRLKYKPHKARVNLMFGNLLCIDEDTNFFNPIWATVQSSEMKNPVIAITLVGVGNNYANTSGNDTDGSPTADVLVSALLRLISFQSGVMVESPTYYHAFKPVLARLQSLEESEFPFMSEILLKSIDQQPSPMDFFVNLDNYKLDESQEAAAEMSLSSRFSLIQGPPGCGKTFVGKEIIKSMLESKGCEGPILLMTYKNHALDSMLEGCLEFTKSVVRIGGKSTSEKVAAYNLHNLYKDAKAYYPQEDFKKLQEAKLRLQELQTELKNTAGDLLTDFTVPALLRFLQLRDSGKQQLHSLLLKNFEKNYGLLIEQNVKYSSSEEVMMAVTDILANTNQELAGKLLRLSLKEWLSEADSVRFLPNPQRSLFIQKSLSPETKKVVGDEEDKDEELEEEEWEHVFAERQVGSESKLEFTEVSRRENKLYSKVQDRMCYLEVDRRERDVREISNVWTLSPEGRYVLLSYWLREWHKEKDVHLSKALENYHRFHEQVKQLEDGRNVMFLKSRDLVACTITGCCLRMGVISQLAPSVVIVEEAAEILESQLIAALPSSVKHVVLIGDHRQLPPQVHHYRLAKQFNLGVSIFERLANNGFPVSQLRFHRRGPQSLCPLFSGFYKQVIVATKSNPKPLDTLKKLGMMYWWTHNAPSRTPPSGTSFENEFEAAMLVGAVRFLIWGGEVKAHQISIIAGYLAQAKLIKGLLDKEQVEGVAVSTIDRFQGDENDFIFLSLTRSASEENYDSLKPPSLGFLGSANRTCVALSRARLGLFIFGCSSLFESHPSWNKAVKYFKSKDKVGSELQFVDSGKTLTFDHPSDFVMFFKKLEFQKKEMKIRLQNMFVKHLPAEAREGVHDVTKSFGIKMEKLMNESILDRRDLGRGKDAHGEHFKKFIVTKVERIFWKDMYTLYLHHQKMILSSKPPPLGFDVDSRAKWMHNMLNDNVNEVFLFHGTNLEVSKLIKESGFDERVASLEGMFGAGTYFAENADKSDQYSESAPHMMFLARVILGRPYMTKNTGKWRRPPPIDPLNPIKLFDSIVAVSHRKTGGAAAVARHQEFVIFDRYQCLPEFLIQYERR